MNVSIQIPGKTFLFGEYVAQIGGPAIVFCHEPYFTLSFKKKEHQNSHPEALFHPESPAGKWTLQNYDQFKVLPQQFSNPYNLGGLGQSSAEFVGVWLAGRQPQDHLRTEQGLELWKGFRNLFREQELAPSGYDVLAQYLGGVCQLDMNAGILESSAKWPFADLGMFILATGTKLQTHQHIHQKTLVAKAQGLEALSKLCLEAWQQQEASLFCQALLRFRHGLASLGLEAPATQRLIESWGPIPGMMAAKGCGAMGADMVAIFFDMRFESSLQKQLLNLGAKIVASHHNLAKKGAEWIDPYSEIR